MGQQLERRRIGAYRVVRSLEGHGREVYAARRPAERGDRHYLLALFDLDESNERELESEVYRCMELDHRAIAAFVEMFVEADRMVLVLEGLQGVPLNRLLDDLQSRGERLDDGAAIHIGVALLGALNCAHTATNESGMTLPLVHAQLGPHQLLAGWDGEVKLLGLGLSTVFRLAAGLEPVPALAEPYLAPEVRRGGALTVRANVHSAAVLVARLLSDRPPPAAGKTWPSLAEARPDLPPKLTTALDVALKASLLERRITCAALLQALESTKLANPADLTDKLAPLRETASVDGSVLSSESFPPSNLSDVPPQSIPVLMSTPPEADDDEFALSEAPTQLMDRPKAAIDAVIAAAAASAQETAGDGGAAQTTADEEQRPPRPPPKRSADKSKVKAPRAIPGMRPRKATLIMGSPSASEAPTPAELASPLTPRSPGVDHSPRLGPTSRKKLNTPARGRGGVLGRGKGASAALESSEVGKREATKVGSPRPPKIEPSGPAASAGDVMDAALGEDIPVTTSQPPAEPPVESLAVESLAVESIEPSTTRRGGEPTGEGGDAQQGDESQRTDTEGHPSDEVAGTEESGIDQVSAPTLEPIPPPLFGDAAEPAPAFRPAPEAAEAPSAFTPAAAEARSAFTPAAVAPTTGDADAPTSKPAAKPRWLLLVAGGVALALGVGFAVGRFSAAPTTQAASSSPPSSPGASQQPPTPSATANPSPAPTLDGGRDTPADADSGAEPSADDAGPEDAGPSSDRGYLTVTSSRAGVVVYVDGERLGSAGARLDVPCGRVTVRLGSNQPGVWLSSARSIEVPCGEATSTFIPANKGPGGSPPTPKKGTSRPKGWSPDDI